MCSLLPYGTGIGHYAFVHLIFIFFFHLIFINWVEWLTIPACPSHICCFNRGDIEGTNSSKMCVCLHMFVLFSICIGTGFVD